MTDRDHFAAAALTGLLASGHLTSMGDADITKQAFLLADQMGRRSGLGELYRCPCGRIHLIGHKCPSVPPNDDGE